MSQGIDTRGFFVPVRKGKVLEEGDEGSSGTSYCSSAVPFMSNSLLPPDQKGVGLGEPSYLWHEKEQRPLNIYDFTVTAFKPKVS